MSKVIPAIPKNDPKLLRQQFDRRINDPATLELLQTFAAKVHHAYKEYEWDLIIGDDTSGRPIAEFARLSLQHHANAVLPMMHVCTSQQTRKSVSQAHYVTYLQLLAERFHAQNGRYPQRVAFISESLGSGETANAIATPLREVFPRVDFIFLGSSYDPPATIPLASSVHIAGAGQEKYRIVHSLFEAVAILDETARVRHNVVEVLIPKPLRRPIFKRFPFTRTTTSYPLHNLIPSTEFPEATITPDKRYRDLAAHCHQTMAELARTLAPTVIS